MRSLTANMEAERVKDGVAEAWLIEGTFDQFGQATIVKRYATLGGVAGYTLGANTWADLLAERGLDLGIKRLEPNGGISPDHTFTVKIRDEANESALTDTHVLHNDPIVIYYVFRTDSEVDADKFELIRGVVTGSRRSRNLWTITCKDDPTVDLKRVPTSRIDDATYPYSFSPNAIIPEAFGNLNVGPQDGTGSIVILAPCRFLSRNDLTCTSSFQKKTGTTPYQWYEMAKRFASVTTYTESTAGVLTVDDPVRVMWMLPSRKKTTNDVIDWHLTKDGDHSAGVAIVNTDNLDVWLSGAPQLGGLTALSVEIKATGNYDVTVYDDTTVKVATASKTNDASIALVAADYEAWDLALLNVEIDGTAAATIKQIYLEVTFNDFLGFDEEEPRLFQKITGFEDQTAHYNDGAVITGAGTVLQNPADILHAQLRASNLHDLAVAKVNTTNATAAATTRSGWVFDFPMTEEVSDAELGKLAFEGGLHLFKEDGQYDFAALDKTRDPQHFFLGDYHMPVEGDIARPHRWQYRFEEVPADTSRIFNEINIRYAKHPATGVPQKSRAASGLYRLTSTTGTLSTATARLTDTSATFVADLVKKDERIYVSGDIDYKVTADATVETWVAITPVDGGPVTDITANTEYWLGPNINGQCLLSQQAWKTTQALGGNQQRSFLEDTGYISDFIVDDTTAENWRTHLVDWFAEPRKGVVFALFRDGCLLQRGDVFVMDHDRLDPSQKPTAISTTTEALDNSETVWDVTAGSAGLFRANDWLYVYTAGSANPECVKVASSDPASNNITVTRAQLNTKASAHDTAATLYHLKTKWICTGVQEKTPERPYIAIEAEEMPFDYSPIGIVVVAGYDNWVDADAQEHALSGWSTLRNGRVVDSEADSKISHVGPATA